MQCLVFLLICSYYSKDIYRYVLIVLGFPGGSDGKESACNAGDLGLNPGLGRSPWRREWPPTPVFLPGDSHGQRSLAGSMESTEAGTTVSNTTNMIVLIFSSLILKTTVPKGCQTSLEFKGGHKTMDWGSVALEIDKNRVHL